jgi:hypothetical protein
VKGLLFEAHSPAEHWLRVTTFSITASIHPYICLSIHPSIHCHVLPCALQAREHEATQLRDRQAALSSDLSPFNDAATTQGAAQQEGTSPGRQAGYLVVCRTGPSLILCRMIVCDAIPAAAWGVQEGGAGGVTCRRQPRQVGRQAGVMGVEQGALHVGGKEGSARWQEQGPAGRSEGCWWGNMLTALTRPE